MPQCLEKIAILRATKVRLSHRNQLGYCIASDWGRSIPARATIQPVSATRKPVIVRKLTRDWCAGYAAGDLPGRAATIWRCWMARKSAARCVEPGEVGLLCARTQRRRRLRVDTVNPERLLVGDSAAGPE